MKNSLKDLTINVKKSLDKDYNEFTNFSSVDALDKSLDESNFTSSMDDSYDYDEEFFDEYSEEDDVIDRLDYDEDKEVLIEPNQTIGVDTIRLIKIKSIPALSEELDNVSKIGVPSILDFKYIQERKPSEFEKVGVTLKSFKEKSGMKVILLGSTKNVVLVVPSDIIILKQ